MKDQVSLPVESLTYEQALAELEDIVQKMESGQQSLEDSIRAFERGQELARYCASLLENAELRIRTLTEENPPLEEGEA